MGKTHRAKDKWALEAKKRVFLIKVLILNRGSEQDLPLNYYK